MKKPIVRHLKDRTVVSYIRVNRMGKPAERIKLVPRLTQSWGERIHDEAEYWFRKLTIFGTLAFFGCLIWVMSVESLGRALAAPVIVEVPVESTAIPPILTKIAKCESSGKQFNSKGKVVTSRTGDLGMYQIAPQVWGAMAKKLGYDLNTLAGNEAMARYIFNNKGSAPWVASSKCWNR